MTNELEMNKFIDLVPTKYLNLAFDAEKNRNKLIKILLEKKKIPEVGWDDITIEYFVNQLSRMDSNNFLHGAGLGEREGRILCGLVAKRHYNFAHGIGRSGDLTESQPKAAGSSLIYQLTNSLVLDLLKNVGITNAKKCLIIPMATGMTISLCFSSLKQKNPNAKYILWSRIDQKSCFKSMLYADLIPIIIDPIYENDELVTDLKEFEKKINELKPENILSIFSTTSCFAPRACDNIVELSKLAEKYNIAHVINNAYGLQSSYLSHQIEQGSREGRIDLFVQSTDKNLLVPVGGAIIGSFDETIINDVSKCYAGRASFSQILDVFMTLLSVGRTGYNKLITQRKGSFNYLMDQLNRVCDKFNEHLFNTKHNPISLGITLLNFNPNNYSLIGSMLFTRGITGARVIVPNETKKIGEYKFQNWGTHCNSSEIPYLTVAAGIGVKESEIDIFIKKISKIFEKVKQADLCKPNE